MDGGVRSKEQVEGGVEIQFPIFKCFMGGRKKGFEKKLFRVLGVLYFLSHKY